MDLYARSYGQGDPIIILHGLFGFSDNWHTIAKQLAEDFMVITLDQRNHGRSPHADTHTYPDLSQDLYHYLTQHWVFKTALIGHSMGGKVAMQFALDYPDMVSRLIVIDIAPGQSKTRQDEVFESLNAIPLDRLTDRKVVENHLMERLDNPGVVQFLLKNLTRNTSGGLEWKMNLPVLTAAQDDVLAPVRGDTYDGPTLFVKGSLSSYIQDSDTPLIQKQFPKAKVITIPDAGHWVHADQPQALMRVLRDFLAQPT